MDFLVHFLFGVELLLFFFALLPCYELLALSNHIIISGLLLFWRSGGVRSLPYLLSTEVGGSSKVR